MATNTAVHKLRGTYDTKAEYICLHSVLAAVGDKVQWKIRSRAVDVRHLISSDMSKFAGGALAATAHNLRQAKVRDLCLEVSSKENVGTEHTISQYHSISTSSSCSFTEKLKNVT